MAMNEEPGTRQIETPPERRGFVLLWIGVLLPPLAWLTQFEARYALVRLACLKHNVTALHAVSLAIVLLILAAAALCLINFRKTSASGGEDSPTLRNRFLSTLGLMSCGIFGLVTIIQAIPVFMFDPCLK
jgi:hypothetical protein